MQWNTILSFHRNGNTPIQVAAYGTRLQAHVEPAFTLAVHVGTPFFMVFQYPLAQPCFMFVEGQIPVFGFAHYGLAAADGAFRINQVGRAEACTALFALVAVSAFCVAVRAFAGDVTVGKESLGFLIVVLHAGLFNEFAFVVQFTEKLGSSVVMCL